jgi:hypothetical protein
MLCEFAVEPALLGEWQEFRYLHEKFGVQRARMIAEFPKKWRRMVYDSATDFTDIQRSQLEDWLKGKEKFLVPSRRSFDVPDDWLHSAELAHNQQPFHAILSTENPHGNGKVLLPRNISIEQDPLFKCQTEDFMPRNPAGFVRISGFLLRCSRQIIFVDPHVKAMYKWGEALSAMLDCIPPDATMIRYCAVDSPMGQIKEDRLREFREKWPRLSIPAGKMLEFVLLGKDTGLDTHNRYILTERGGIKFPWGLDAPHDGSKDMVNIMAEETHATMFEEYSTLTSRSVLERLELVGEARKRIA